MKNLEQIKELIKDRKENLDIYQEKLLQAPNKFIGAALKHEEESLNKWIKEEKLYIKALETHLRNVISQPETIEQIKEECRADCENHLGVIMPDALAVIEAYLERAYQAGKNN